jgi:putative ABC transport system permease protein
MIAHALLTMYRSLARHRMYAALNVFGLAVGIALFMVLTLIVHYEYGFDRWIPGADNIYRLDTIWSFPGDAPAETAYTSFAAQAPLMADFKQIVAGTRMMPHARPVSNGAIIDSEEVTYVDPNFLQLIRLPLVEGQRDRALSTPAAVAITETMAEKYFGTVHALGRILHITENGSKRPFTVTAVLQDMPQNTSLSPVNILTAFTPAIANDVTSFTRWDDASGQAYLQFANQRDAQAVATALRSFVGRRTAVAGENQGATHPEDHMAFNLVSLPDTHFHDVTVDAPVPGVDRRVVLSLGAIGVLALLTAAINYINLATARSDLRAREVAMRKVVGATQQSLMAQFIGEAVVLVAAAALIGLALTELALPVVNALGGWAVRMNYALLVPLLLGLILVLGVGAGFYPALLLAAYRPAAVLASARTPSGGRKGSRLRNVLVLMQFAGAIGFAICTLVVDRQADFLHNADRGFQRAGLIIVKSLQDPTLKDKQTVILNHLRNVSGVLSATLSDREPASNDSTDIDVSRPGLVGLHPHFVTETVGRDYFRTYGIRLLAGRVFDDAHRTDDLAAETTTGDDERILGTVINATAASALGFASPQAAVGHTMMSGGAASRTTRIIIGVVQDVRFMSPRDPVSPQLYTYDTNGFDDAEGAIRVEGARRGDVMQRLRAAWRGVVPDIPFVADTADGRLAAFYQPDQQRARLFSAGAVFAIIIACLGLYGLASFSTSRRTKEMGIRKTLGASTQDVLLLLIFQFIRPVLIANLIAWPIAWAAMRGFLSGFDQRISLSPLYFLAVGVAAMGISVVTVLGQAVMVAGAEPAKALRYE